MVGETTLAMLYVPLFFYIFDRLAERRKGIPEASAAASAWATTTEKASAPAATGNELHP
jgi:multidrug efflux pump